jgi:divalent metal cation (Fe/Co/Zn/Cd) transporter
MDMWIPLSDSKALPLRTDPTRRHDAARRGRWLSLATLVYNIGEGLAALFVGVTAGSVALLGFGIDSVIEVISSVASLWRLRSDADPVGRIHSERIALRTIGACFLALAVYILGDAGHALVAREVPGRTIPGVIITALSVVVMPLLAREKRKVAVTLGSRALGADATQTSMCAYLSLIVLCGVLLNVMFGWWWADPVAALAMVPIIAKEGIEGLRGEVTCDDCC